tara:strand:+ start:281 stop:571 length:291 start_codon:yes stop_codon:yes gene_type:complete
MAKYISIPVTAADNFVISADSIVTCMRVSTTTTDIMVNVGQTANLNIQLTHAADTVTASVAKSIMDAVVEINELGSRPEVVNVMTPAQAVSAVAVI